MTSPYYNKSIKTIRNIRNSGFIQPIYNAPNYIPVNNYQDFEYDVYAYYNEYYATAYETQQRRNYRNYINSQNDIKKSNKNVFQNSGGKKFYFYNTQIQSYMVIENTIKNSVDVYININSNWCRIKHYSCEEWKPVVPTTYMMTYNGNTNTSGTAPVDSSSPYILDSIVTVLGNSASPALAKTGYTFAGWNSASNGTGTSYSQGDTFTINRNNTLYAEWTPVDPSTYTITYNGNTNTSGNAPIDSSSPYTAGSSVTVLGNSASPALAKTGYTFAGWNSASNGTGTSYSQGDTFTINRNNTLYAEWTPVDPSTYTITYNGNTNTSGNAPIDSSSPYTAGSSVTVLGNSASPALAKTGYQFAGWNTSADNSGTNYVGGNTFTINTNITLYANWIIGGVRLRYNANSTAGGTGTVPSSSETYYTAYSIQPVVDNTGPFTNTNDYTFGGWNSAANGTGISYPVGSNVTMPGAGTVTLYAQWINPVTTYTLTYNAGTGGSGTAPIGSPTNYSSNSTATILGNTGSFSNGSLVFYSWNTAANGSGTSFSTGSNLTMIANTTLYAQWVSNISPYTVTYDANGATGGSVPATPTNYPSGVEVPILGQGSLNKLGYAFLGWNGSPTGAGSSYAPGYTFISKTETLYALWAPGSTIKNCGGGGTGGSVGTPAVTIEYFFPFAQIIQSSDTITVYTTALLRGTTTSNYGTGTAPLGMNAIASKTVITSSQITINTNTSYANPTNDNNYSTIITNGSGVTYWPSGATISNITYATLNPSNSSIPTYNISTRTNFNGCGLTANVGSNSGVVTAYSFFNQGFTINFSNGSYTFIANSPTNVLYTASTSPANWITAPKDRYPYQDIQDSFNALTAITIIPSGGSTYISPSMPNYTVQYDGNNNTSGSLPNPQYMDPYVLGTTSITLRTNSGVLAKTGFTFSGWNTAADGTGTSYPVSATYNGTASLILYAKWV